MNRILLSVLALVTMASLSVPVFADSPHFIYASSGINGTSLTCTFKEAGLGNLGFSSIQITCSASATAIYECVNHGRNHPQAANKETVTAPVSTSGTFPIRNGQTTGMLTVSAPGPGNFACPPGQDLVLYSVTYTNVMVSGAGASMPLASQSYTNPTAPTP